MKRLFLILTMLVGLNGFGFAQAILDNAVIPVSVTLQSILRLNVVSGGNIEFSVNALADYVAGINVAGTTNTRFQTKFNVSSSTSFKVNMVTEVLNLVSVDGSGSADFDITNIQYVITNPGGGLSVLNAAAGAWSVVPAAASKTIIDKPVLVTATNAGTAAINDFLINWALHPTPKNLRLLKAGRYSADFFLTVVGY